MVGYHTWIPLGLELAINLVGLDVGYEGDRTWRLPGRGEYGSESQRIHMRKAESWVCVGCLREQDSRSWMARENKANKVGRSQWERKIHAAGFL